MTTSHATGYFGVLKNRIKPYSKALWKQQTWVITTASDTEYVQRPNHPNEMITTQIAVGQKSDECWVLEHPKLGLNVLESWQGKTILSHLLGVKEVEKSEKIDGYLLWEVMMFFAPSDLMAGLFNDYTTCEFIESNCKQDARIMVDTGDKQHSNILKLPIYLEIEFGVLQLALKVLDLAKLSTGGLKATVEGFGGVMRSKGVMDDFKKNMLEPYQNPELLPQFIDYAKDDACVLFFLRAAGRKRTRELFEVQGLEPPDREILTTGSLVAELLESYLENYIGDYKAWEFFTKNSINGGKVSPFKFRELLQKSTVKHFAEKKGNSRQTLALIQGGRAKNERPTDFYLNGVVADPDLSGCYVSIQRNLIYPVGMPSTYGVHESNPKKQTLGWFLKTYGSELEPRLWFAVVNGKLEHHQNLVFSKVIDTFEISEDYDPDDPKIQAAFRLYTRELINGVITSDVLDALKNVCSDREYSEWMNLELVSAAWYPLSLKCESPEDWYFAVKAHAENTGNCVREAVSPKSGEIVTIDKRSRHWLGIPLEGFLKPYVDQRKALKVELNQAKAELSKGGLSDSECEELKVKVSSLDAQQNAMKLVGNTNYGVLASPYFDVGNVVIANVITAAARVAVWATAMATGAYQSITDGGAYNLNAVRDWRDSKPSLNTLSLWRNDRLLSRFVRSRLYTKPLASESLWSITKAENGESRVYSDTGELHQAREENWYHFDNELLAHVKHFFRGKPLPILDIISFSHKDIYREAVFHSQTNYKFVGADGKEKIKARGFKLKERCYNGESEDSNIKTLLRELGSDPRRVRPYKPQTIGEILKCNMANELRDAATDNALKNNGLLAGDTLIKRSWVRPLSLSMFHWQNDKQYASWQKSHDALKQKTGWGIEQHFLNEDGSVDYVSMIDSIQGAIDKGEDWLYPVSKTRPKNLIVAEHPYLVDPGDKEFRSVEVTIS